MNFFRVEVLHIGYIQRIIIYYHKEALDLYDLGIELSFDKNVTLCLSHVFELHAFFIFGSLFLVEIN